MKAGFTLVEALVGLAMLSLIMAGLTTSLGVIGRLQRATADGVAEGRRENLLQRDLAGLMAEAGPFRSDIEGLEGSADGFHYDCGQGASCSAQLGKVAGGRLTLVTTSEEGAASIRAMTAVPSAHFIYHGEDGDYEAWPPDGPGQVLVSIRLADGQGRLLALAPVWRRQPAHCEFDPIAAECRRPAP